MPVHEINRAQSLAIEHASGPVQVIAGPGSGKTYLTIRRIRHLISHHRVSPDKILVITFTKAAAVEMKERFTELTGGIYDTVHFGTFHAIYFHMLKQSKYENGKITLASESDKRNCLRHILHMYEIENADNELITHILREISSRKNQSGKGTEDIPSVLKNTSVTPDCEDYEDMAERCFPAIYQEYCRIMEEEQKLDFDDMILLCNKMLEEEESILKYWQQRFSHILVDEFQDIGEVQYRVLKMLASPENNIFVVGDDDQSIYGFRGAGPSIMKQFMTDYEGAAQIFLDTNYRSTEIIVGASLLLIGDNKDRFLKRVKTIKKGGSKIKISSFTDRTEEYKYLTEALREMPFGELEKTAVICRTNMQSSAISRQLSGEQIPFCIREKTGNLFEHYIAGDLFSYLQFSQDNLSGKGKRGDLLRIMNKPCRYIERSALKESIVSESMLMNYYEGKAYMQTSLKHFFTDMKKVAMMRPYLAVDYIRKTIGYDCYLCDNRNEENREKLLETADEIQHTALKYRTVAEWAAYVTAYTEEMRAAQKTEGKDKRNGVDLITMHSSKGLEYDNVFLPDVKAGNIPSRKAVSAEQLEEERRLFYVAMTRAKQRLEIMYYGKASPFLEKLVKSTFCDSR